MNRREIEPGKFAGFEDLYDIYPGYEVRGTEDEEMMSVYGNGDIHDLWDRKFREINGNFSGIPSRVIDYRITAGAPLLVRVLDVGGGRLSQAVRDLADMYQSRVHVTNVDVVIRKPVENTPNCHSIVGDVCELELPDESIDLVYTCSACMI